MRSLGILVFFGLLGCSSSDSSDKTVAAAARPEAAPPAEPVEAAKSNLGADEEPSSRPAKSLEFRTADGKPVRLADYKGKVVAVMFFSTDCPHCQNTTAFLSTIYDEYAAKGVEFLGLAVNPNAPGNIDQFISTYGVKFPMGLTTRSTWAEFGEFPITQNTYVPHMIFIDKAGNVGADHRGGDRQFWMEQQSRIPDTLDRLLAQ